MKKRNVFPGTHFPARPPILTTAVATMAADLYQAPGWVWGVSMTLLAILWVVWVVAVATQELKPLKGWGEQDD